jgi:hypothetical protein
MAFTGNEKHDIKLEDAAGLTRSYRDIAGENSFRGAYFGRAAIQKILDQEQCVGIRIYNAVDDAGGPNYVLVGVTEEEKDLYDGELAEFGLGCPPHCDPDSPLAVS